MSKLISMYWKRDKSELTYPGGKETVLNCDIVVVGGGGSGSAAVVRAAEAGAEVIVVKKMFALYGGLVLQASARRAASSGMTISSVVSSDKDILSTEPSPCGGSMAALTSGYSAGVNAAEYLKKI